MTKEKSWEKVCTNRDFEVPLQSNNLFTSNETIMKNKTSMLLITLMNIISINASAHDIEVVNANDQTIYYNYINDGQELEVTFLGSNESSYSNRYYKNVVIPEEVTYMGQTRRVTAIGKGAFHVCNRVTSVTIPNSVTTIGDQAFAYCI